MSANIKKFTVKPVSFLFRISPLSTEFSLSHSIVGDLGEGKKEVLRQLKDIGKGKKAMNSAFRNLQKRKN